MTAFDLQLATAIATSLGLIATISIFIIQLRVDIKVKKAENYQALELASNQVFRFEAENHSNLTAFLTIKKDDKDLKIPTAYIDNHLFQILNLFEISTRFYKANYVDEEIYISWIVWFFEVLTSWYFREIWVALRINYTDDLQEIFDEPVRLFSCDRDEKEQLEEFFYHISTVFNNQKILEVFKGNV